ncbi:hypothetical protein [Janthinobacterium sp. 78]|uniref:hypothetical protein n=1 Tax=Janthinobacterium sp. 78 TaxID=2135631 RepID=UPI0010578132|nr:hypothetical protein [Janthinobacterium sp. 78]
MRTTKSSKSGGGKLSRSETVTVRLDPRLRYLAEVAARAQRRTLSSFIEWSIEMALNTQVLNVDGARTVADEAENLWDVNALDRFAKLARRHPHLLTHEEQVRWKEFEESQITGISFSRTMGGVGEFMALMESMRKNWEALVDADGLSRIDRLTNKSKCTDSDETNLETG